MVYIHVVGLTCTLILGLASSLCDFCNRAHNNVLRKITRLREGKILNALATSALYLAGTT